MGVKRKKRGWSVSEKLEIVQARQKGLTLEEVSGLYRVSGSTVIDWTKKYEDQGISGLEGAPRGGARQKRAKVEAAAKLLEEVTRVEPESGVGKAQGMLYRHGFLALARETVRRLLRWQGHQAQGQRVRRRNRPMEPRFFERALPNELWQTDIMTFMLKGQYRVYMIGFMDDHSRFMVGWGLYRFQTAANVQEVFRAGIEKHGLPKEVLSDNGRQYYTWRGKSRFTMMLLKLGIRHIRSRPYHPQTLGKIESFWRNLLQECLSRVPLGTFDEAREKIGEYIEYYNFKRPHQGIGNVTPSDRFYGVADQVKQIIEANTSRMEEQAPGVGDYTPPAYLVGNLGGKELRVVAKSAEVTLRDAGAEKIEPVGGGSDGASQAPQPAGTAGPDPVGTGEAGVGQESVPASGGIKGIVLPMDERGTEIGTQSVGNSGAGTEVLQDGDDGKGFATVGGAPEASGEAERPSSQGAGSPEADDPGGAADHPAQRVGTDSPGSV